MAQQCGTLERNNTREHVFDTPKLGDDGDLLTTKHIGDKSGSAIMNIQLTCGGLCGHHVPNAVGTDLGVMFGIFRHLWGEVSRSVRRPLLVR